MLPGRHAFIHLNYISLKGLHRNPTNPFTHALCAFARALKVGGRPTDTHKQRCTISRTDKDKTLAGAMESRERTHCNRRLSRCIHTHWIPDGRLDRMVADAIAFLVQSPVLPLSPRELVILPLLYLLIPLLGLGWILFFFFRCVIWVFARTFSVSSFVFFALHFRGRSKNDVCVAWRWDMWNVRCVGAFEYGWML